MKFSKKRLNDEFEAAAPALKSDVLNAPIITAGDKAEDVENGNVLVKRKIGLIASCGAAALLVILFALLGIFGAFRPKSGAGGFAFSLEINPAVSFVTDKGGKVLSVNALNGDADIVLSDENTLNKLTNVPLRDAVVTYTDCAARLGFLDLSKTKNAVRLSGCTEGDGALLDGATQSLQAYFKTNGIYAAVIKETVSVSALSERAGVKSTDDLSELTSSLENLSTRFGERIEPDANEDTLKDLYETYIVGAQTFGYVQSELLKNLDDIALNAQMLSKMSMCNYNIMMHRDNPFNPLPADYWTVKRRPNAQYTPEFAALMAEMEGYLGEYENKFGAAIGSVTELSAASDAYSSFAGIDFEKLFSSLTKEYFQSSAAKLVGMLKNIGHDVDAVESLLSVPQTTQEYFSQLQTVSRQVYKEREERFKEIYAQPRSEITEAEYDDFIADIVREYGSLESFWDKK